MTKQKEEMIRIVKKDQMTLRRAAEILAYHNVDESVIAVVKELESELKRLKHDVLNLPVGII